MKVRSQRSAISLMLLLAMVAIAACSPGTATGRGGLGSPTEVPTSAAGAAVEAAAAETADVVAPTPTPEGPRPLVVVSIMGETGVMERLDGPAVAGVAVAIERLNDDGGLLDRQIELRRIDTNSRISEAESAMRRVVENPPDLVVVSCDVEFARPVLELAEQAGIVTISPCADDAGYLTGAWGSRNFTMGAPAEARGGVAAEYALANYGPQAVVLRDVTNPEALRFCDGFERSYRELGGAVVYRDEFSYDTLEPLQDRLDGRGRDTSFVVVCSHVPGGVDAAPSIITLVRTLGFNAPILAGSSFDQRGWFSSVPLLGELTFVSWSSIHGNDPVDEVNEAMRLAIDNEDTPDVGVSTVLGVDAIDAWARAVRAVRASDPAAVSAALSSFAGEDFATGEISFVGGARMDIGRDYRILQVVDGQLTVAAVSSTPD